METYMKHRYAAYMLRLWQVGNSDSAVWRASLENPHTGELRVFASMEALFAFLVTIAGRQVPPETMNGHWDLPLDQGHE